MSKSRRDFLVTSKLSTVLVMQEALVATASMEHKNTIDLLSSNSSKKHSTTFTPRYRKVSSCRRWNFIGLCSISGLCCLLLLVNSNNTNNRQHGHIQHKFPSRNSLKSLSMRQSAENTNNIMSTSLSSSPSSSINNAVNIVREILHAQRLRISNELKGFGYSNDILQLNNNSHASHFVNHSFIMAPPYNQSDEPIRSLIVTSWRSGSTFLGDILNAMPANYYHYEPLLHYGIQQIRTAEEEKEAIIIIKKLLLCDYHGNIMHDYLSYGVTHTNLFEHNERLWSVCKEHPVLCWQSQFLTPFCKLFPLQSMKTVRLRLRSAEKLLSDRSLNVRIVLLVRDPRGTIQSRRHRSWCAGNPDCYNPKYLCDDLVDDYEVSTELLQKYPNRFRPIRYEDLSLNPYEMTQSILQFYGLPFDAKVEEFLDTHTKVNMGGVSSTYRDSKSAPFHWKSDLKLDEIKHIQDECTAAMDLWSYRRVVNFYNYTHNFDPIIYPAPFT